MIDQESLFRTVLDKSGDGMRQLLGALELDVMSGIRHPEHCAVRDHALYLSCHVAFSGCKLISVFQAFWQFAFALGLRSCRDEQHRAGELAVVGEGAILPERGTNLLLVLRAQALLDAPIWQGADVGQHDLLDGW